DFLDAFHPCFFTFIRLYPRLNGATKSAQMGVGRHLGIARGACACKENAWRAIAVHREWLAAANLSRQRNGRFRLKEKRRARSGEPFFSDGQLERYQAKFEC